MPVSPRSIAARPVLVEGMEERVLFATFTVTNTNDSGAGSLRDAINKSNATSAADVIAFKIGSGAKSIQPRSSLPGLKYPVTLDGNTQPGYAGKPLIEIRGDKAGGGAYGLTIHGGNSTVKGLVINRFGGVGILAIGKGGNTIKGTYVGTDAKGSYDAGNGNKGIILQSAYNTIGGPSSSDRVVVSGNNAGGVQFYTSASTGNKMYNTYVGTDASGNKAIPNTGTGVTIHKAGGNTIGNAAARNVISGNSQNGITINGSGSKYNTIINSYIGTNAAGNAKVPNAHYGIEISEANNTVGGTTSGSRNVISGNKYAGVVLWLASGSSNKVIGNYIGTDASGMNKLGNSMRGVDISNGSSNNLIQKNVISGNDNYGVLVYQGNNNRIDSNTIGLGVDKKKALGNGADGIRLPKANNTTISYNTIGHNGDSTGAGIHANTSTGTVAYGNKLINDHLNTLKSA